MSHKNCLEDPRHPLLGPNIKSLYAFGLLHSEHIIIRILFAFLHISSQIFVYSMVVGLYLMRDDLVKVLFNVPLTLQSCVCICKSASFVVYQEKWQKLIRDISTEELAQNCKNKRTVPATRRYTIYCRTVTYLYWCVIVLTSAVTILSPFVTYVTSHSRDGVKGYPRIISSWFPFDVTQAPGYFVSVVVHVVMIVQGGGIIASFDTTVFVILSFLKGQLVILKMKCSGIFGGNSAVSRAEALENIRECHRLHNFLTEQYKTFNELLSPVMFVYVLICSAMICCCVVQLNLDGVTFSEKFWILEYVIAAGVQLFIFCWHSNEVTYESSLVDRGIFDGNWWRADPKIRGQLALLSGKLSLMYRIRAGPFTTLSMPTFTEILRGAYSFYTLLTKSTGK